MRKGIVKKFLLSGFVLATFLIYSIHQRSEGSAAVKQVTTPQDTATQPTVSSNTTATSTGTTGQYKDGTYTGTKADAVYGYIQVQATISGSKLTDVTFLQHPNDRRDSIEINNYAMPRLTQQAIAAQSASVDGVSGATDTSQAFVQSLGDALSKAAL